MRSFETGLSRLRRRLTAAGAALLLAGPVFASDHDGSSHELLPTNGASRSIIIRGPYVQLATSHSIYVVWRTDKRIQPVVRYGDNPGNLDRVVAPQDVITRVSLGTNRAERLRVIEQWPEVAHFPVLHSAYAGTWQYEARISGLQPESTYYYAVCDGETRLTGRDPSYRFKTHPPPGKSAPVRMWIVGDSGTGRENQSLVHDAMLKHTARDGRPIDLYLHLGDMAYNKGKDVEFQSRFFEMYEPTLRNVVCWPTMGNHEGSTSKGTTGIGPYYDAYVVPARGEAGGVPSGTEAYYAFDYGRVHFICLDSHDLDRKPTGAMAQWLKLDLERTKADWILAFFHHPPYTKGSHDSDRETQLVQMRTHIMPILESHGVDVVLTGHSHIYERSMLMDGAYATPTIAENVILDDGDGDPNGDGPYQKSAGLHPNQGTIQVVAGHGGTRNSRKGTMPVMRKIIVEHGSVIIDIEGDTLTGFMLNKFAEVRDTFSLVKRGHITPRRILNPWQPPDWKPPRSPGGEEPAAEVPEDFIDVIPRHAEWHYLAGSDPEGLKWTEPDFDAKDWKVGIAGFGYGMKGVRTELTDMQGNFSRIYLRREFEIEHADYIAEIGMRIFYDDGFVAYLNGKEVARKSMGKGHGKDARDIRSHPGDKLEYVPLKDFEKHLKSGRNVLAIEGHNSSKDSSDFLLDPDLIIED
ncbi:MAG TPA: metallophosphoesterase family protein [Methylomirabilota bacterium]|nr:metallophosphoesterase family protein [Methylomirabilota bacterium]